MILNKQKLYSRFAAGPKIVALLRSCSGPTSSIIGEKLKSTKVYIQKNRKVANYASVPLVIKVEL